MQRPNGIALLLFYLLATLLTGAVLSPWLFWLGKWYAEILLQFKLAHLEPNGEQMQVVGSGPLGWVADKCRGSDFSRYFNRAMLVSALGWLWPFSRWAGVTRQDLGLVKNRLRWQDVLVGFMLASGLLLLMGTALVKAGVFTPLATSRPAAAQSATSQQAAATAAPTTPARAAAPSKKSSKKPVREVDIASVLATATLAAVCVALMEEFFFRGALLGLLLRTMRERYAVIFLAAFFALIHLLQPPDELVVPDDQVHAGSGFWIVSLIFSKFGSANFLVAEFSTLLVVGVILGWARLRTQSLWLAIGLHAGWVFGIKLFAGLTRGTKKLGAGDYLPWIGRDLKIGAVPLLVLGFTGLLVLGWLILRAKALKNLPPVPHEPVAVS